MVNEQEERVWAPRPSVVQRLLASNYRIAVGVLLCSMVVFTWRATRRDGLYALFDSRTIMGPLLIVVTELYFYISASRRQRTDLRHAIHDARLGAAVVGTACAIMLIVPWVPASLPNDLQIVEARPLYWILFGYLAASHLLFACFYRGDGDRGPA